MTVVEWSPTTCACIVTNYKTRNEVLKQKCRSHDTVAECRAHNHANPSETDQIRESKKPEFQRR